MSRLFSKSLIGAVVLAGCLSAGSAHAFGDRPYWPGLGYEYEPQIASGCWKWNWQQHSWYDHCPVYVRPKANMYSRGRSVLRVRG
ncbi:hypothetical protein RPMA_10240 [Tardiphaga alba]|uniref:Uncharacterized protein n=1 Tax=Tardiphaga alba TaxID=340268 RepID=A0ABX8A6D9_9BRAD|nr:hypothetical protein RPMA_10240 [Tardiphaga alba]